MRYISSRGVHDASAPEAVVKGLADDGGLFCPPIFPKLTKLADLLPMPYAARAACVMSLFLEGYSGEELARYSIEAYGRFEGGDPAPTRRVSEKVSVSELWHGPTCAFKDMALRMLPHLMRAGLEKTGERRRVCVVTATSGDTGKAALEGFRDVPGTAVFVCYPHGGVSETQRLQMATQEGKNVGVTAVRGNFDDAQTAVKSVFADRALAERLEKSGWLLSSANSINLGRLIPQAAYYVSAYCDMVNGGSVTFGAPVDVAVPTGNFGNILAAYYAKMLGLPLGKLICASNRNDVLTDFFETGVYDRRRELYLTTSPSMDILVSSNFERALFHLSHGDTDLVRSLTEKLAAGGVYVAPDGLREEFAAHFVGGSCDDEEGAEIIRETWERSGYLLDPHTAVAFGVAGEHVGDNPCLVISTASPFKFSEAVCAALGIPDGTPEKLAEKTGLPVPEPLRGLERRTERFKGVCEPGEISAELEKFLRGL